MVRVTMKIRTSSQQQVEAARNVDIFLNKGAVVIRMKCFHGVETGSGKRWKSRTKTTLSGVGD